MATTIMHCYLIDYILCRPHHVILGSGCQIVNRGPLRFPTERIAEIGAFVAATNADPIPMRAYIPCLGMQLLNQPSPHSSAATGRRHVHGPNDVSNTGHPVG